MDAMLPLESSNLFSHLPPPELARLKAVCQERSVAAGEDIFCAGDPGDGLYVVKSGRIRISVLLGSGERHPISEVPPGDVFGEMSVLDSAPRSATATALTPAVVYFVPRESLVDLLRESPALSMKLFQEISARLREFNQQYLREVLTAERLALVGRFASSIVHDLKNPLCIIGLAAELMAESGCTPGDRAQARARIAKQVDRITDMVNDILEFTRGGAGVRMFDRVDFATYIRAVVDEFRPELMPRSVTLQLANEPPALKLALDPHRLHRVFNNLFGNAVDMMPQGGELTLRFDTSPTHVTTTVEDTGPGIAPEVADRLFEAFVTFGKPKGTGLGLSITRKIIEEHGGTIRAANRPQGGAAFAFTLPRPA